MNKEGDKLNITAFCMEILSSYVASKNFKVLDCKKCY